MKAKVASPTQKPILDTIVFTRADQAKLNKIVDFMVGMEAAFDLGEIGHSIEYAAVSGLLDPAVARAQDFRFEILDRFRSGGAQ